MIFQRQFPVSAASRQSRAFDIVTGGMHIDISHPLCTPEEFGHIVRLVRRVVTRKVRQGIIEGHGRFIHIREAAKFGMGPEESLRILIALRTPAASQADAASQAAA